MVELLEVVARNIMASPFESKYRHLCISQAWLLSTGLENRFTLLLKVITAVLFIVLNY